MTHKDDKNQENNSAKLDYLSLWHIVFVTVRQLVVKTIDKLASNAAKNTSGTILLLAPSGKLCRRI